MNQTFEEKYATLTMQLWWDIFVIVQHTWDVNVSACIGYKSSLAMPPRNVININWYEQ